MTAYNLGKCRCDHCKNPNALYRAKRRAAGKDNPPNPAAATPTATSPATGSAAPSGTPLAQRPVSFSCRASHDLRHAHASWLLAGGADLQVVKERLVQGTIATTACQPT